MLKAKNAVLLALCILLISAGCAGRKVRSQARNHPSYDPSNDFYKQLSGPNFTVRIFSGDDGSISEVLTAQLKAYIREALEPKGFRYTEELNNSNVLILIKANTEGRTVNVPAQFYSSFYASAHADNNGASAYAGGGSSYVGAHTIQYNDRWLDFTVMELKHGEPPVTISEGASWPKHHVEPFYNHEGNMRWAIKKFMKNSVLSKIDRAPSSSSDSGPTACWYRTGIRFERTKDGQVVVGFDKNSDARKLGVSVGDQLKTIAGRSPASQKKLKKGEIIEVGIVRNGTERQIKVPAKLICLEE